MAKTRKSWADVTTTDLFLWYISAIACAVPFCLLGAHLLMKAHPHHFPPGSMAGLTMLLVRASLVPIAIGLMIVCKRMKKAKSVGFEVREPQERD